MQPEDLIPANEFCFHHNIEISFIHSLKEYGLIEVTVLEEKHFLHTSQLSEIEKMMRLHYDLNINFEGIDVITNLLEQIEHIQDEMIQLQNKLRLFEAKSSIH